MSKTDPAIPFDRSHLSTFTGGDMALERELLEDFLRNARSHVETLRSSLGSPLWSENAHRLKGAASGVGMRGLARVCSLAEALPFEETATATSMLENMSAELERLGTYLAER